MKGSPLIYFFLILGVILHIPVVSATTYDSTFNHIGGASEDWVMCYTSGGSLAYYLSYVVINDVGTLADMTYLQMEATGATIAQTPDSRYQTINLKIGATTVGSAIYGYTYNPSRSKVWVQMWFTELDLSAYSGKQTLTISDYDFQLQPKDGGFLGRCAGPSGDSKYAFFSPGFGEASSGSPHSDYTVVSNYNIDFDYNYSDTGVNRFQMERDSTLKSKLNITIDSSVVKSESTAQTYDVDYVNSSNVWGVSNTDVYGLTKYVTLYFNGASSEQTGTVNFNQSYYTSPELVGVEHDIENFDNTNNEYWILLTGTNDGIKYFVTTDYYDITTATGQDDFTISYNPLTLPFTMQAELWHYSKVSGVSSVLAYSPLVEYNPASQAPGNIWTEKENYNISEIFYIQFDTNYNTVQIELISSDFYDLRTMEGPGLGHLGYLFNDPHNFTAYLIEDGIKTNYTDFTVSADTPFLNIHVDTVPVNQGFCFSYYTDNTSDTITGYRPDGSIFYGPTTNLITLEKVDICGPSSSSPAGIYTMSLLHEGTEYHNDTIVMTSANEYIYFESSKYETGDRMIIHYYIMDRQQRIRLSDSLGTAVVTWTCDAFYITPNMGNSLWFSLIDNNEYGLNMNASIDAGTFRTGNWKVEIIGIDGKPLTDYDTYDYTTVNKKIETSEDQTTEFILLIFSPEGLFLILTSVLMLAGLVAAKHPAGGAAGAAVGVGFGVFFGALPVWMLLLMVILLVVLAGVGTAVYFKGK